MRPSALAVQFPLPILFDGERRPVMQLRNGVGSIVFAILLWRPPAINVQKSTVLTLSYFYEAQLRVSLLRCLIRWGAITPTQRVLRNLTKDLLTSVSFLPLQGRKEMNRIPVPLAYYSRALVKRFWNRQKIVLVFSSRVWWYTKNHRRLVGDFVLCHK